MPKGGCSAPVKSQSCRLPAWQGTPGMWMVTLFFTPSDFFFWPLVRQFWSRWALWSECTYLPSGVGKEFQSSSGVLRARKGQTQQLPSKERDFCVESQLNETEMRKFQCSTISVAGKKVSSNLESIYPNKNLWMQLPRSVAVMYSEDSLTCTRLGFLSLHTHTKAWQVFNPVNFWKTALCFLFLFEIKLCF